MKKHPFIVFGMVFVAGMFAGVHFDTHTKPVHDSIMNAFGKGSEKIQDKVSTLKS